MDAKLKSYKWLIWSLLSFAFIIVFIHRFGMAAILDDLARSLQLTGVQLSNLAGVNFYAYALMQIPAGVMVDYIGPRKIAASGMCLAGIGSILFSQADDFTLALGGRLLVGLGVSIIFVSLMKIQAEWFKAKEFSTMSGLTSLVGNLGSIIATAPLALFALWIGWRQSFQILGYISLVVSGLIYLLVRNRPADLRMRQSREKLAMKAEIPLWDGIKQVLQNRYTWPSFFALGGFVAPVMTFLGVWGISYLMQAHHLSKEIAANYTFYLAVGIMIGGPLVGLVSDRLKMKRKLLLGAAILYTIVWAVFIYGGEYIAKELFPVIFLIIGFLNIFHILAFTNVKEVNHPRLTGIATSVVNGGEFILAALVNLLTGLVLDFFWQGQLVNGVRYYSPHAYKIGFSLFILSGFLAIISAALMKERTEITRLSFREGMGDE